MPNLPKSAEERARTGNPGHRPIEEPLAVLEGLVEQPPDAPDDLGPVGRSAWQRVWPVLVKWARPDLDLDLVRRYCQALDEREEVRRLGQSRSKQAWRYRVELHKLEDRLLKMEHDLGLSPAGRKSLRIETTKPKPVSKLDRYLTKSG